MTEYTHRASIFVDINKLTPANAAAAAWDEDTGGDQTFGALRLSATGNEPATHSGCNTLLKDAQKALVLGHRDSVPFYNVYFESDGLTWELALAGAGLQVIQSEQV